MVFHIRVFAILFFIGSGIGTDDLLVFAMGSNEHTGIGKDILQGIHLVYQHVSGTGTHEKLNTAYFLLIEFGHQVGIVVGSSEIEGVVHDALGSCILELVFQCFQCGSQRIGIWHIHVAGYTSGSSSHTFGVHVGLVCQARITEMYMVVNYTRDEVKTSGIDGFVAWRSWSFTGFQYFGYYFIFYHDGTFEGLSFVYDACVVDVCSFHVLKLFVDIYGTSCSISIASLQRMLLRRCWSSFWMFPIRG